LVCIYYNYDNIVFSFHIENKQNLPIISTVEKANNIADWDTTAVQQWLERIGLSK